MEATFEIGAAVRVVRNVRDDGTYPGAERGERLVARGSVGYVRDRGTFLQDQVVYAVEFVEAGRVVGCREAELIPAAAPWVATRFEARDRVTPLRRLAVDGEVVAGPGAVGEVLRVLRDREPEPAYHVRLAGRTLVVPESRLAEAGEALGDDPEHDTEGIPDG